MQLALDFRATGPADWILSVPETRVELRAYRGLDAPAGTLFRVATHLCHGDGYLMREGILQLVEDGVLTPQRYAPWMPSPTLMGNGVQPMAHAKEDTWEGRRTHPLLWIYRVASVLPWKAIRPRRAA